MHTRGNGELHRLSEGGTSENPEGAQLPPSTAGDLLQMMTESHHMGSKVTPRIIGYVTSGSTAPITGVYDLSVRWRQEGNGRLKCGYMEAVV